MRTYLSEVAWHLRVLPRQRRARVLAEISDHLRCAADDIADGQTGDRHWAEAEAVRRFGAPQQVVPGWVAAYSLDLLRRIAWLAGASVLAVVRIALAARAGPLFTGGLSSPVPLVAAFILSQAGYAAVAVAVAQVWLLRRSAVGLADIAVVRRGVLGGAAAGMAALGLRAVALLAVPRPGAMLAGTAACAGVLAVMAAGAHRIARRAVLALESAADLAEPPVPGVRARMLAVAVTLDASPAARLRAASRALGMLARLPWPVIVMAVVALAAAGAASAGAAPDGLLPALAATPAGRLASAAGCAAAEIAVVLAATRFVLPVLALPGPARDPRADPADPVRSKPGPG